MSRLVTEAQIAEALGIKRQAVNKRAKNGRRDRKGQVVEKPWTVHSTRKEENGNETKLYLYTALPADVQKALDDWAFKQAHEAPAGTVTAQAVAPSSATAPLAGGDAAGLRSSDGEAAPPAKPKTRPDGAVVIRGQTRKAKPAAALTDKDKQYQENALLLCQAVEAAQWAAGCTERTAIHALAKRIIDQSARAELVEAARLTYTKPRQGGQTESALVSRLQKMMACYRQGALEDDAGKYLVIGRPQKTGQKHEDIVAFLRHYCKPSRPPVSRAWKSSAAWYEEHGLDRPAVDTWRRIEHSLPVTLKYRGRMTGPAYTALKPYVSRDVSMFHSNDIWVGDGHTFKARVQSPLTGKPFRPEVTLVIDWVSRKVVGWSVDLAESTIAVSAALRHAQLQTRARLLIYYSDNGSGQTGKSIDAPLTGTAARQGFCHETGIPGHPQGRGIIERVWSTILIPLAESYPTFMGKNADRDTVRRVGKALDKAERSGEMSPLVPAWSTFMSDVQAAIDEYNSQHTHRSLGGKTPNAVYDARLDPDSLVFGVDDTEIHRLWMPEEIRTVQRGRVSLFNNEYCNNDLPDILAEGEKVRVRYDIHDASRVLLLRMDGSEIGEAVWNANRQAAFPVSRVEQKREERVDDKLKRLEKEADAARAELSTTVESKALPELKRVEWAATEEPAPLKKLEIHTTEEEAATPLKPYMDTIMELYAEKAKKDEEASENETADP